MLLMHYVLELVVRVADGGTGAVLLDVGWQLLFSWFPAFSMSMMLQFVDDNYEAHGLIAAMMVAGRVVLQ
ncbi:hypothetical protein Nepgr_007847 [Nepenthes gracilis]|uniref:Uncharacterized protein n=1 Tax=Nepenthes gracilis TaxID=150966 RepID=A0AAD3S7M2_NEPGR|nr:hypothetical protein Nepgr_007847 [Nepenthes gracilis]